ncbi:NmrA family NAD(P)-binding protein [Mycobacterium koreense]|uniref:NmrA family transcriptional regulator n=1 Tax=Mycolicibacillus koreensis TaxID=1069220 RepID=A0A7I7S829_9MYCO|nr:NmrA family NAD(P)-binding protein [Mycolicibacillus koreensis]MCV7247829.1 NmrA family NAD(P)-binding protein [Mycolicibacillus koreensis]ODR05165.1 NmrA family transcriptional regulator [Mycolicibacillus koreensis]OSC33055.1 NmrA family transcriptional regulator [Mycolicibacillus koreensis]BBY53032.1 NmrA family transcriptional regulator [Mycolicibacillus koreensis]
MTVLITGGTGLVGSHVIAEVLARGERVRTLSRRPDTSALPADVEVVAGSLSDTAAMRTALDGVDGLFLLSPVSLDELTGSLQTLDLARAAGVEAVVYLSVIHADIFTDPPHFAAKAAVEKAMADFGIHATVLRPGIYLQNDLALRDRLIHDGVYDPPVGNAAALFTDVGDLAEVAAAELLRRLAAPAAPAVTLDVVAPQILGGDRIAEIWSAILGRQIRYGGDDLDRMEATFAGILPNWLAYDLRLMYRRFQRDGMIAAPGTDQRLKEILGRPMRSYTEFARETAESWKAVHA